MRSGRTARDEVGDVAALRLALRMLGQPVGGHGRGTAVGRIEPRDHIARALGRGELFGMVQPVVHEFLQPSFLLRHLGREGRKGLPAAHFVDAACADARPARSVDVDHQADLRADQFALRLRRVRNALHRAPPSASRSSVSRSSAQENRHANHRHIVVVVSDVIGERAHLRFQRGPAVQLSGKRRRFPPGPVGRDRPLCLANPSRVSHVSTSPSRSQ